jgi:2,4-dienoyl-CoA reductase-like NADH-dependent reductase (Old Yellow Enzyme family)
MELNRREDQYGCDSENRQEFLYSRFEIHVAALGLTTGV